MAINVSQSFHRTSANAIDDTLTLTKAQMLAINDNLMPSKYLTICQEDGKIYLYDKSATPSVETGKFSVFEGGESLPSGGTTGQLLAKKSSTDGDVEWKTVAGLDPIQVSEMPTASVDELGKIYQYIGSNTVEIDFADDAVHNFVGEGNTYFYSIANNNIQLKGHNTGAGIIKCTQPLTNRGTIQITKTYNGVATNIFTNKTRIGTTIGGNDVYESPDWGRASSVETIDLSQFAEETLYISFRVEVTQINSGQIDVYTISSVLYDAADIHTNGYFYKCKSKDEEGTTVYYWDEIPVQEIPPSNESISLEDFNALTQEEKDDGTAYYIYDAEAMSNFTVMGNRFDKANIYTEDERMIGSYLGKPLYQKTLIKTGNSSGNVVVPHGLTDFTIVNGFGTLIQSGRNGMPFLIAGIDAGTLSSLSQYSAGVTSIDTTSIYFYLGSSRVGDIYYTVQYTKTNDATVNIGTGNDYSTEEQIIGSWIDGKRIYQKTIEFDTSASWTTEDWHTIGNIGTNKIARMFSGFSLDPNSDSTWPLDSYRGQTSTRVTNGSGDVLFRCPANFGVTHCWITIQYTKTTD